MSTIVTPSTALRGIWALGGGSETALSNVDLTGAEPALPSSFQVGTQAQASIAASGLAAAEIWHARTSEQQTVAVDMLHAALEFRSERLLQVEGFAARQWDPIAGVYPTGDQRFVRLHTNLPHHRDGILAMLSVPYERADVAKALLNWDGEAFETEATRRGLVVALMRSPEEWLAHPHGQVMAGTSPLKITKIGDAAPRRWGSAPAQPLSDIRVLDLTRIIAGPVCGRTLAAHGADVLLVASPALPFVPLLVMDTGRGKRSCHIDLTEESGRTTLSALAKDADIFVQGYRPGAIAGKGFAPERLAEHSPGIVCVSLSAYGTEGPWGGKRGFDSLVQTATGINHAEARAAGQTEPRELPAQALDHASGYLMATGAMLALARQRAEGGSWLVEVSLAATGQWLTSLGRNPEAIQAKEPPPTIAEALLEASTSGFGPMRAVRHAARLSRTPAHWRLPSVPLGTHEPRWVRA